MWPAGKWQSSETFCVAPEHDMKCMHYILIIDTLQYFHFQMPTFNTLLRYLVKLCPFNKPQLGEIFLKKGISWLRFGKKLWFGLK